MKVKLDDLAQVIQKELEQYQKLTNEQIKVTVKEVGQETKARMQSTAPKRSGRYRNSWVVTTTKENRNSMNVVVHSRNQYQLTHLLEFGHAKRNGGRTTAIPHIAQAEQEAVTSFENKVKEILENG
ncbi:HK97 gp10 family phage protein [Carnobacteriaceae bacterium zg-84]|uniref:HK97 gp10 family phage protein n=1 Tax=Granulicatella sp. zg-84 TaxID=2678503 RepID=UPI0013C16767|nr:HK97 gp10 family phage protein [Granulicatella sp. zg-84]NEW66041.1 HK97 gp10 family phage protein [Granulicatella sp. zg-84]QMI86574.1 HK97 gp10 family phage protein [Carnobacteriaceae bacterium zg-84]